MLLLLIVSKVKLDFCSCAGAFPPKFAPAAGAVRFWNFSDIEHTSLIGSVINTYV